MNCPNCLTGYNTGANLPRILIGCGHTLCDYCIGLLFDKAALSITCPECFSASCIPSPSNFPKNIALLNMSESSRKHKKLSGLLAVDDQAPLDLLPEQESTPAAADPTPAVQEPATAATLCRVHHKKIEAFCMKDKSLLCIDCILAEIHRAHKIESIPKAFEIERQSLFAQYHISLDLEEKLRSVISDVERHIGELGENADKRRAEITSIFNEIRRVVHEKESQLKQSIAETMGKEEHTLQSRKKHHSEHLRTLLKLKRSVENDVEGETHIEFLSNCRYREKLAKVAISKVEEPKFRNPFPEVKREAEIATIFRTLNPKIQQPASSLKKAQNYLKQAKGVPLQHSNSSGAQKSSQKQNREGIASKKSGGAVVASAAATNPRDFNQTSPSSFKRGSEKYPSYFHVGVPGKKEPTPIQKKTSGGANTSQIANTSINKLHIRKVQTQEDDDTPRHFVGGIQSNRAARNLHHPSDPVMPYNISPSNIDSGAYQSLTERKRSAEFPPLSPKRMAALAQNKKGFPTRSEVTLTSNDGGLDTSPPPQIESNQSSTQNLLRMIAKESPRSEEPNFNRVMEEVRYRNEQRQGTSVERVKWMKKSTLNQARAKAKLAKKGLNYTLEEALSRGDLKPEAASLATPYKRLARKHFEDQTAGVDSAKDSQDQIEDIEKTCVGMMVEPESEEDEEECLVGHEGKPNNSKTSPDPPKPKGKDTASATASSGGGSVALSSLVDSQKVRGCKVGKVIEVSLLSDEIRPETQSTQEIGSQHLKDISRFSDLIERQEQVRERGPPSPLEEELKQTLEEQKRESPPQKRLEQGPTMELPLSPLKHMQEQLKPANKSLDLSNSIIEEQPSPVANQSRDDLRSFLKSLNEKNTIMVLCKNLAKLAGYGSSKTVNQKYTIGKDYWGEMKGLKLNRSKFAAVTIPNGSVLVIGGKKNEGKNVRLKSIQEFSPLEETWVTKDLTLPEPRSGMGAVIDANGRIYVCGGNANGHISSTCLIIDILKSNEFVPISPMRCRRDEFALTIGPDHKLYAIGGFGGTERAPLRACERYDPETGEWESIAPLNEPRRALAGVCLPDGVYAIGGFDKTRSLATVERYDIYKNKWSYVGSMKQPRCTHSAVASPQFNAIYAIGGFDEGPLDLVEKYDVLNDQWEIMAPLNHPRFMHQSVLTSFS